MSAAAWERLAIYAVGAASAAALALGFIGPTIRHAMQPILAALRVQS